MKHAIIILAHKESENLFSLVQYFDKECDVFIHFDKKAKISPLFISKIEDLPQVKKVYRKYTVNWGGFSILRCEMFLFRKVLKLSDAEHIHLLSGQDYPLQSLDNFLDFFEKHYGMNFISYAHLPKITWQGNTFNRIQYFYPTDIFTTREELRERIPECLEFQKRMKIKRHIPLQFDHLYGGSQWLSLSRIGTLALVNYTSKHKWFYWRFLFTFAPEEVYVHTVLLNILPKNLIFPHNYRFIRWKLENGNSPSNLGKEHFHLLVESEDLFARKFEEPYSKGILPLIKRYLLNDSECVKGDNGAWIYDGYKKYSYEKRFIESLFRYIRWTDTTDVLDIGCGAGLLVAALRRLGIFATGFDANPFTPQLSSRLLPENDIPCYHADLVDGVDVDSPFDVVICLDVLQEIPKDKKNKALQTLASLTKNSLIISIPSIRPNEEWDSTINYLTDKESFRINKMASSFLKEHTSIYQRIIVLEK